MPLLNFKKQFVPAIRSGRKRHTIRADRKIPVKVGDKLYLYCGARTKGCFKVLPAPVICSRVETIKIHAETSSMVTIDNVPLDYTEREALAYADGFSDWDEMLQFWEGRLPFKWQIIHWRIDVLDNYDFIKRNPEER